MARIVLTTFGSLGDLHPYLAVGSELVTRGHAVTLVTHEPYRERATRLGMAFAPMPPDIEAFPDPAETLRRAMDERQGSQFVLQQLVVPFLRGQMQATLAAAEHTDLIVGHPATLMTPHVAEALGKRWASVSLQPCTMYSRLDPATFPRLALLSWLMRLGPGLAELLYRLMMTASRPWLREVDLLRAELGLPRTTRHPLMESVFSPHLHLAWFSPVFAPPQRDWPPHSVATGFPLHDRGREGEGMAPALTAWLDAGEPPIVFTLGSSAVHDPGAFFHSSAAAAQRLQRRAVLLVGADPRTGEPLAQDAAPMLEHAAGESVVAVAYAPHSELMPRAAAVVHQCGIGTMGQALRSGRPMLATPFSHDQPDNAEHARRLGVARILPRRAYDVARAEQALGALLADPAMAQQAAAVGARIAAEHGARAAADALERVRPGA